MLDHSFNAGTSFPSRANGNDPRDFSSFLREGEEKGGKSRGAIRWGVTKRETRERERERERGKLGPRDATRKQVRRSSEMVYENFIVGPRCSAVVFKVLSRRLRFASPRPGSGRAEGEGRKG